MRRAVEPRHTGLPPWALLRQKPWRQRGRRRPAPARRAARCAAGAASAGAVGGGRLGRFAPALLSVQAAGAAARAHHSPRPLPRRTTSHPPRANTGPRRSPVSWRACARAARPRWRSLRRCLHAAMACARRRPQRSGARTRRRQRRTGCGCVGGWVGWWAGGWQVRGQGLQARTPTLQQHKDHSQPGPLAFTCTSSTSSESIAPPGPPQPLHRLPALRPPLPLPPPTRAPRTSC